MTTIKVSYHNDDCEIIREDILETIYDLESFVEKFEKSNGDKIVSSTIQESDSSYMLFMRDGVVATIDKIQPLREDEGGMRYVIH